jgi:hypothetical protein
MTTARMKHCPLGQAHATYTSDLLFHVTRKEITNQLQDISSAAVPEKPTAERRPRMLLDFQWWSLMVCWTRYRSSNIFGVPVEVVGKTPIPDDWF